MTDVAYSDPRRVVAHPQPLSLRYRRLAPSVPLRVFHSSACRRVRRVVAPAGESLSFVASNESNQSKDALHLGVTLRLQGFGLSTPCLGQAAHMLRFLRHTPRYASVWTGNVAKQRPYCSWAPWEASRSAGVWGRVRSTLRQLTSRGCLSAVNEVNAASSARGPKHRAPQSSPALAGPPPSGRLSFGSFSLAKQRKGTALSGAHPDAASRSEQHSRQGGAGLRYLSLSGLLTRSKKP